MNPRLVKFAVELQCSENEEKQTKKKYFNVWKMKFNAYLSPAKVTVPIENK